MAAVVGPVSIHQAQLGQGGVPLLLVPEIGLEELQIGQVHGKAVLADQVGETGLVPVPEALQHRHIGGHGIGALQGLHPVQSGLPALHRVDEVALDPLQLSVAHLALEDVDGGGGGQRPLSTREELDALGAGVGPLVILPRQGLHREDPAGRGGIGESLVIDGVHLRLTEHGGAHSLIGVPVDPLHVVAVEDADARQALKSQLASQLTQQAPGLHVEAGLLFGIAAKYVTHYHNPLFSYIVE